MKGYSLSRNTVTLAVVVASLLTTAWTQSSRTFTVTNHCPFTIWYDRRTQWSEESADTPFRPAILTDLQAGTAVPSQPTGWEQASGATVTFAVPYNWAAGRIWGRTECNFTVNPGPTSCATGGCNGGLLCDPGTGGVRIDNPDRELQADGCGSPGRPSSYTGRVHPRYKRPT
jgi:hypothetical protein